MLTHHLRQLLLLAVDPGLADLIDAAPADRARYAEQARSFAESDLSAMLTLLIETHGSLRRAEAPRILLEVCLVDLCTLPTSGRIEALIDRLDALEARLGGGAGAAGEASREPPARGSGPAGGASAPRSGSVPAARGPAASGPRPEKASRGPAPSAPAQSTASPDLRLVGPPPAIDLADEGDAVVRWRRTVDRVKARKLLLGTCLEEGVFLGIAGSNVRVALSAEHSFHRAMLEMKENRVILNEELERLYGKGSTLQCVSAVAAAVPPVGATPAGVPPAGAAPAAPPVPAAELDEEVPPAVAPPAGPVDRPGETGMVQRILEMFDGEILEPGPQGSGA